MKVWLAFQLRRIAAKLHGLPESDEPIWIVNDYAELGVMVGGRCFFMYKGGCIEYDRVDKDDEPGRVMHFRQIGKREFGETTPPDRYQANPGGRRSEPLPDNYREEIGSTWDLSWGNGVHDERLYQWQPIPFSEDEVRGKK